ncbi:MAG: glycoside hydrolase family 38 C-terminal domain-containing protein [Bacteroidota bacterium]
MIHNNSLCKIPTTSGKTLLLSIVFLLLAKSLFGQINPYLQGFEKEISGKRFGYHSPLPDVNTSLLIRGHENYEPIEWETEPIPDNYNGEFVSYIWLFGMDVSAKPARFHLNVNGNEVVSFTNSKKSILGEKKFEGKDGAELVLNTTMLDKHEDQMGIAILRLPKKYFKQGEKSILKVSSSTMDNAAWFMTYKSGIEEKTDLYQNKVVVKEIDKLFHSISVDFIHIGDETDATITIGDKVTKTTLITGFNKLEIYLPKVKKKKTLKALVKIGNEKTSRIPFKLEPVKEWEIFMVQHTHTDIGYTRPQTEILPEHLRFIDHALDYCDQTDDYPDAAKFRWTCETSWSVREYLRTRPQEQIDRLLKRVKEDRIEVTGMFLNYSEIIDENSLAAQLKTLKTFKDLGIDVKTAMQDDVNGIAWSLVDYYNNTDVKYVDMGVHAHRARKPFNQPTAFWWQSPSENRMLAYRSEHYQHGNTLGITSSQDILRNNLSQYLTSLEDKGYPYDKISLQFSGYVTDNSPPSTKACDIIKEWNDKYEWPKLRSALAKDFLIYLEEQHTDDIPKHKVAWPDWWTDGTASAANETKQVRQTHTQIGAISSALALGKVLGVKIPNNIGNDFEAVYDNLLFYDEHTHGAAESVRDPLVENTINQWNMKSAYAWEAKKKAFALEEKVLASLEPALNKSDQPIIAVFNTLNWKRSGMIHIFLEKEIVPSGADFTITDLSNKEIPYQEYDQRPEGSYFGLWVKDIPPIGYKTLKVNIGAKSELKAGQEIAFENSFYEITLDENNGLISRIYDKQLSLDLIDKNDTLSLGNVIYEELANRHEMERLTSSTRDTVYRPLTKKWSLMSEIKVTHKENGPIYNSVFFNGVLDKCCDERGITIELRLYHYQKKIELLYKMIKLQVRSPEGLYVSFPFNLDDGKLAFEAQGGVVYPGINQLEGSSSDWNTIQNFAAVKNENAQIVFVSDEIPLVQFGDINTGRYYYRLKPKTNHIYSWVLNNYWVTNFKASQEGELRWTYQITSSGDNSDMFATKFGWSERTPLLSRIMLPTKGSGKTELVSRTLIDIDDPNLLLVSSSLSMDRSGIILHLREVEGGNAQLDIEKLMKGTGAVEVQEVNVLEEKLTTLTGSLLFNHHQTKFLKLIFE